MFFGIDERDARWGGGDPPSLKLPPSLYELRRTRRRDRFVFVKTSAVADPSSREATTDKGYGGQVGATGGKLEMVRWGDGGEG